MKFNNQIIPILSFLFFLLFAGFTMNAQWKIPEEFKSLTVPEEPTYQLVKKGKDLYNTNCASCHGNPGQGNNLAAVNATDLGTASFLNSNEVGSIYYKIREGMGAMPSFKDKLSEDEKWQVVYYIKSFDESFKISGEKIQALNGVIELKPDNENKTLQAKVKVFDSKGLEQSAEGVELVFYVKRIFGNLPLEDPIKLNSEGTAIFNFPEDIPGDESGKLEVIAGFNDTDTYGKETISLELNWGKPLEFVNETLLRTLWGPNNRVPIWLLAMYWSVTIGVWLVIFYVIFQITRIKKAGIS